MLTVKEISAGLSRLDRDDRIRVAFLILGMNADQAAEAIERSGQSVRMALSRGDRDQILDMLEALYRERTA